MGPNADAGELRMLFVGTGVWKKSRILPEDRALAKTEADADHVGCLITEVVVPGFHWEDHKFLDLPGLQALFRDTPGEEESILRFEKHIKKSD